MVLETRTVGLEHDGTALEGVLVHEAHRGPRPGVILFPTVRGRSGLELQFAELLAKWGYSAFAADLYGQVGAAEAECREMMTSLRSDRGRMQNRLTTVLDTVRGLPEVDAERIAAIGFCFGGQCALDLARTGADIRGVASFHGLFDAPGNLEGVPIKAKVLALHGWDDPMVPPEAVIALAAELTAAGADWQIHAYGHTSHGFTNPAANNPERGVIYNEVAARRSWKALEDFLVECFA